MRFLVILLASAVLLSAQTPRKGRRVARRTPIETATVVPERTWPIAKISIEGNKTYATADIVAASGLTIGQKAGEAEFDAARDRLLATGAFETVGYRFEPASGTHGYLASFQVVETSPLFPYRFEAIDIDPKVFREFLRSKEPLVGDKVPGTQAVLQRLAKRVEEFLSAKGTTLSVVGKLTAEQPGQLIAVFSPSALPSVAEIYFKGNTEIPEKTLQAAVSGAGVGALYTEERFRQILEASVRPLYEARGRLRIRFPKIETTPASNVKGLVVTVQVQEGPEFKLAEVDLQGATSKQRLLKLAKFPAGDIANFTQINAGVSEIARALRREGYIQVKTDIDRNINDQAKTVDIVVRVQPGPRFNMGKLTIEGLDLETEPHIRKIWALKSGEPYNSEYPDYFLAKLKADELFDNLGKTTAAVKSDPESRTVDVTIRLAGDGKRRPTIGPDADRKDPREQRPPGF